MNDILLDRRMPTNCQEGPHRTEAETNRQGEIADPSARPPPGETRGALHCVGVLPGLGHYRSDTSSDSDDSSDSDSVSTLHIHYIFLDKDNTEVPLSLEDIRMTTFFLSHELLVSRLDSSIWTPICLAESEELTRLRAQLAPARSTQTNAQTQKNKLQRDLVTDVTNRNRDGSGTSDGDGRRPEFRIHHLQRLVSRRCRQSDTTSGTSPAAAEFIKG
ncbi:unnamed protein product [Euphydryas editha]|uniref:Uncharacterized protein n=1 Tax=Euphydryas editha TaxID=104508 RepID=A0AAU9UDL4_EUPED|nr:unnamed protein product [Euphydryas editha]